ncbi:MAG: MFS transporter [Brevinematia bacterium]
MVLRLSLMMFLQFCVFGSTLPIFSLFWKDHIHLSGSEIGIIFSLSSISSLISPMISSFIADKYIRAKYILSFCNFFMGIMLLVLRFQTNFYGIFFSFLVYSILSGPVIGLVNAISFHTLSDEREKFGNIRVWGTAGYMFVGAFFSFVYLNLPGNGGKIGDSFILAGLCAILLSFFVLTLPDYRMKKPATLQDFFPFDALKILFSKEVLIVVLLQYVIFMADRFYFLSTAPFLSSIGIAEKFIMPIMSLGQFSELFAMFLVGILLPKIGYKKLFTFGVIAELMRFSSYLIGNPNIIPIFGVAIHGFTYAFIYVTVSIFLDENSTIKTRTALHQLFSMLVFGVGGFFGNIFAGRIIDFSSHNGVVNYRLLWLFPVITVAIVFLLTLLIFPVKKKESAYAD